MSEEIPTYMTADEFIGRLFYLGPFPFGFTPESVLEELLKDIDSTVELKQEIKADAFDIEEQWRELYYKHLSAIIEIVRHALIHETMYARLADDYDGKIVEFLDDNETAKAKSDNLAEWFQEMFLVGLPREFPQSANHINMLVKKFGIKADLMEQEADEKKTKVGNLYSTIALLVDFIADKQGS